MRATSPDNVTSERGGAQQNNALLRLRQLLLAGEFEPGQRLAEIPLAERLHVSRTPLRLALIMLEHEGLVEEHPTRGYIVRGFRRSDVFDAIEIRGLLEGMAARLVVEGVLAREEPGKVLVDLRSYVAEIQKGLLTINKKPEAAFALYGKFNQLFHKELLKLADSPMLTREMERITCLPFAAPSSAFVRVQLETQESRHILQIGQDQHHAILEALERREASRVETLLREHARISRRNIELALEQSNGGRLPGIHLISDPPEPAVPRLALKRKRSPRTKQDP